MKTMSAMAIYRMKTLEVMSNVETDHEDYPDSYYLDDDMIDDFLSDTDSMLDYLASMIE